MSIMPGLVVGPTYLLNSTPVVTAMRNMPLPVTVGLNVTSGDTLTFSQSFDNGLTYSVDAVTSSTMTLVLQSSCTNISVARTSGSSTTSYFTVC